MPKKNTISNSLIRLDLVSTSELVKKKDFELTSAQKLIINAPEAKIVIEASAAALKTTTLTERVRYLLKKGHDPSKIAVITFTRMAASELVTRLGDDNSAEMFVGTIHSLAGHFLSKNGYGDLLPKICENVEFDKLFELCEEFNLDISKEFDTVFLDEAQDSPANQLHFIFDMMRPVNFCIAFDEKQTIFSFNGANPQLLRAYLDREEATFYLLKENFRCGSRILDFARAIIRRDGYIDDSIAARGVEGKVIICDWMPHLLEDYVKKDGSFGDWAILTRTNNDLAQMANLLNHVEIPYITFKQSEITRSELIGAMKTNRVKLLTIHSSKGLTFNKVLVYNPIWFGDDAVRINYVAATRARDLLLWCNSAPKRKKNQNFKGKYTAWE